MFGSKKKLLSNGAQAEGVVMKAWRGYGAAYLCVRVRVELPDGSTGEFEQQGLWAPKVGALLDGYVVPVRYDPADFSKVTLDLPLMEQRQAELVASQKAYGAAHAETEFDRLAGQNTGSAAGSSAGDTPAGASDPVDRLAKLADLRERGALTDAEFAAEKAKVLGEG